MAVAFVHYHLWRGGVTRVLEAQSEALRRSGIEHVILSSTPYEGHAALPVQVVPDLRYREEHGDAVARSFASELRTAARKALGEDPACWHLHNPTLGKNTLLPGLIEELCRDKERLVLQFHDFAEDGRPSNYRRLRAEPHLYPLAPQIRYAFINSRDRDLLIDAGVPAEATVLLPNAVHAPSLPESGVQPSTEPIILYPVRGIRRKNLGELNHLASLAPDGATFALTLAPQNQRWQKVYRNWEAYAAHHRLPVEFGAVDHTPPVPGADSSFESWLTHATHLLTTSIAEGFGLAFLEPIALGKPLLGRDLPEITKDFRDGGESLGNLYEDLLIPKEWVDQDRLSTELDSQLRQVYDAYDVDVEPHMLDAARETLDLGDYLDFGNLPESLQAAAITRALSQPDAVMIGRDNTCLPAADWLEEAISSPPALPDHSLLDRYGIDPYSELLHTLYEELATAPPEPVEWLDKSAVLARFLKPDRFHFLRT